MYKRMLMIGMLCMGCSLPMSYSVFAEEVPVTLEAEENEKEYSETGEGCGLRPETGG